jgi:hypothetical protein
LLKNIVQISHGIAKVVRFSEENFNALFGNQQMAVSRTSPLFCNLWSPKDQLLTNHYKQLLYTISQKSSNKSKECFPANKEREKPTEIYGPAKYYNSEIDDITERPRLWYRMIEGKLKESTV